MHYMTTNAPDARQQPRFGAKEGMGAFAGLAYTAEGNTMMQVSYFRSDDWQASTTFLAEDVGVVQTTFEAEISASRSTIRRYWCGPTSTISATCRVRRARRQRIYGQ